MPRIHGVHLKHRRNRETSKSHGINSNETGNIRQHGTSLSASTAFDFDVENNLQKSAVTPSPIHVLEKDTSQRPAGLSYDVNFLLRPRNILKQPNQKNPTQYTTLRQEGEDKLPTRKCKRKKVTSEAKLKSPTLQSTSPRIGLLVQEEHEELFKSTRLEKHDNTHTLLPTDQQSTLHIATTSDSTTQYYSILHREVVFPKYLRSFIQITPQAPKDETANSKSSFDILLNEAYIFTLFESDCDKSINHDRLTGTVSTNVSITHEEPIRVGMINSSDNSNISLYFYASTSLVHDEANKSTNNTSITVETIEKSHIVHQLLWDTIFVQEIIFRLRSWYGPGCYKEKYFPRSLQKSINCLVENDNTIHWKLKISLQSFDQPTSILGRTLKDVFNAHEELNGGPIPDSVVASLVLEMLDVISCLHGMAAAHNNLRPESFLIIRQSNQEKPTDRWTICLVGFGHSGSILKHHNRDQHPSHFYSCDLICLTNIIQLLVFRNLGVSYHTDSFWSKLCHIILSLDSGIDFPSSSATMVNADVITQKGSRYYFEKLYHMASKDEMSCFFDGLFL